MKIKNLFTLVCLLVSTHLLAQTKLIAHKSHSGRTSDFALALENNLFDMEASNFGVAPVYEVKNSQLDSLIFLSDTSVIMVTSEYCGWIQVGSKNKKINDSRIWKAGKDTVFHHQLFSRKNSIHKIKKQLKKEYFFKNLVDSVKFINYEVPQKVEEETKKQPQKSKKELRKEKRIAKKEERKYNRWAKKNCDCDCDCNEEQPASKNTETPKPIESKSDNSNQNNQPNIKMQMLPPISCIGLLVVVFGLVIFKRQGLI